MKVSYPEVDKLFLNMNRATDKKMSGTGTGLKKNQRKTEKNNETNNRNR